MAVWSRPDREPPAGSRLACVLCFLIRIRAPRKADTSLIRSLIRPRPLRLLAAATTVSFALASCAPSADSPAPDEPAPATGASSATEQSTTGAPEPPSVEEPALTQAGVSAGHPLAVQIGEQVLIDGGNAVDAAIAVAIAQSVVEPPTSGLGGGGSAIVASPEGEPAFHDYREVVNDSGVIPSTDTGIPGFVAGMGSLHEEYGELDWGRLVRPSAELAAEGFPVSSYLANRLSVAAGTAALASSPNFAPNGQPLGEGDWLVQPDLAGTLNRLADAGWRDFYTGALAQSLSAQAEGVDLESLAGYTPRTSEPVSGRVGEYEVVSAAPALPGVALIDMLQDAEADGIAQMDPKSAEYVDTLSRAWLAAEQTILTELGDPAFVDLDLSAEDQAAEERAAPPVAGAGADNTANTTHVSVVDTEGMTVSMTNTILNFWGSGQMVDGYFLNNHLYRFSSIPSEANSPAPGKRPVTWSNPTMVLDPETGEPVLPIGSPGGPQILNIEGTVLVQWLLQDRDLQDAINTPRFRASGNHLYLEETTAPELRRQLEAMGWSTEIWPQSRDPFGSVQALEIDHGSGTVTGADDPRRNGAHAIITR